MRFPNDRLALHACILAAALVTLAALAHPGTAHAQVLRLERIGPKTVGSKLAEVRGYPHAAGDCQVDKTDADCTFLAPDGVQYVVNGDSVSEVIALDKSVHGEITLPFGLKLGESLASALPKLTGQGRRWTLATPDDGPKEGVVYLSSEDNYQGENGTSFSVDVYFEHDRLVRVDYDSDQGD
jgi:hypothetical protein